MRKLCNPVAKLLPFLCSVKTEKIWHTFINTNTTTTSAANMSTITVTNIIMNISTSIIMSITTSTKAH